MASRVLSLGGSRNRMKPASTRSCSCFARLQPLLHLRLGQSFKHAAEHLEYGSRQSGRLRPKGRRRPFVESVVMKDMPYEGSYGMSHAAIFTAVETRVRLWQNVVPTHTCASFGAMAVPSGKSDNDSLMSFRGLTHVRARKHN
jgi:hypothetical protein